MRGNANPLTNNVTVDPESKNKFKRAQMGRMTNARLQIILEKQIVIQLIAQEVSVNGRMMDLAGTKAMAKDVGQIQDIRRKKELALMEQLTNATPSTNLYQGQSLVALKIAKESSVNGKMMDLARKNASAQDVGHIQELRRRKELALMELKTYVQIQIERCVCRAR